MHMKLIAPFAFTGAVLSQSITDVIGQTPDLSTLGALLTQYPDVASALGGASNITILAPSNAAFEAFLTSEVNATIEADGGLVPAVLQYHVLNGTIRADQITDMPSFPATLLTNTSYTNVTGGQVVKAETEDDTVVFTSGLLQESRVTTADVAFSGGVVHIIDTVLTIPASPSDTATAANLTQLVSALGAAELVSTVDDAEDITAFVPADSAFAAIANLAANLSSTDLATILQYHVIQGTVGYSTTLMSGATLSTLEGNNVTVTMQDDSIFINGAEVVMADVLISNGVAHVIDQVLNPANSTATPAPDATAGSPNFDGAESGEPPLPTADATGTGAGASPTGTSAGLKQNAALGVAALFGGAVLLVNM